MLTLKEINRHPSIEKSIEITKYVNENVVRLPHLHVHILYILREIMKEECKVFLEIGTYWGGSLAVVIQSKSPCKFLSIDNNKFIYEHKGPIDKSVSRENIVKRCIDELNIYNHKYDLIVGDSLDPKTLTKTKVLAKNPVDLLFIDGLHETRQVINDFNTYFPLVRDKGIIVFDDYMTKGGVKEAVDNLIERNIDKRFVPLGSSKNFIKSSTLSHDTNNSFIFVKISGE